MVKAAGLIHPVLFAVYPVLFLYSNNMDYPVSFAEILTQMAVSVGITLALLFVLGFALKDTDKAGLIASLFIVLFSSYGHVYNGIDALFLTGFSPSRHMYLLFIYWILFCLGVYQVMKTRVSLRGITRFLDAVASIAVVLSLVNVVSYELGASPSIAEGVKTQPEDAGGIDAGSSNLPDIYYIILDGYASGSTLKEIYNFDNREFRKYLAGKGFYIAEKSRANYAETFLSLASSLNMEYVNTLSSTAGTASTDRRVPYQMIRDSDIARFLKARGYKFVTFRSGWGATEYNQYADLDIHCGLDEFSLLYVRTTMLQLMEMDIRRDTVMCSFSELPNVRNKIEGPRFVFAHILVPHPPYLFDREGRPVMDLGVDPLSSKWNSEGYLDQLIFVNSMMEAVIDKLLSGPGPPPVIILQADHGPWLRGEFENPDDMMLRDRMGIFNAYYLPGNGSLMPYASITPVNTFRLVSNRYFNAGFEMLEDRSFFSSYSRPYNFTDVSGVFDGGH